MKLFKILRDPDGEGGGGGVAATVIQSTDTPIDAPAQNMGAPDSSPAAVNTIDRRTHRR